MQEIDMRSNAMSYNRCMCRNCHSVYAPMIASDEELEKVPCPSCGKKELTITEPLSFSEMSSLFQGG